MGSSSREIFDRLTEAINNHDADAIGELFAPDAESVDPFARLKGRDAIVESWRELFVAFPDAGGEISASYDQGNTSIDEWTWTGTHSGPLRTPDGQEIPATGKQVRVRGVDLATVENGLITSHRVYFDQMEMLAQLGLLPQEAATA